MAVTKKTITTKEKTDKKTGAKIPSFKYVKIITPSTGRNGKNEKSEYPTLPELIAECGGVVEVGPLDANGVTTNDKSVTMYLIDGINAARYTDARFLAINNADAAAAKINAMKAEMAAKFNMTVEQFEAVMAAKSAPATA